MKQSPDGSAPDLMEEISFRMPLDSSETSGKVHSKPENYDNAPSVEEERKPKSLRFKLSVFFLCTVSFVAAMDAVIVASCLVAIAEDLHSTSNDAFWIGTAFLLSQTVTIPIFGTMSEIFGRKSPILAAISTFTFGSILCATAKNVGWLIGGRVVQGVGAGGMIQLVQVILSDISTMSERGLYMALAALAWSLGTNLGVPLGGAIGLYTTWRWVFWINIPICVICGLGLVYSLHLQQDTSSLMKKLKAIDWLGISIFTCATTLFLVGLTSGGVSHPWNSATVIVPLVVGLMLYPIFICVQWRVSKRPMMPLRIFHDRSAISGFVTSYLQGLVVWCYVYYMIIFFLGALQHGVLHSAAETMTTVAYSAPAGLVASILVKRIQRFKYIVITGWVLLAAGMGSNVTMHPDSSKAVLYAPRCLASIGAGLLFPTPLFAVQARQRGEDVGIATSIQVFARSLGTSFGVALGGVILQNQWTVLVENKVRAQEIPSTLIIPSNEAEVAYAVIGKFPESVQGVYRSIYANSLITVWYVMMGLSLLGLLVSLVARNDPVRGGLSGKQNFQDKIKVNIDIEEREISR